MPPLAYCKMAGTKYVVSQSRSKKSRKKPKNLHTKSPTHLYKSDMNYQKGWCLEARNKTSQKTWTPTHKITHALIQIRYESSKGVGSGFAAAHPFWGWIWDLYKGVGDLCVQVLRFSGFCVISCFETVTQHISVQPFCNMSMEALNMMVKQAKHLVFCRPAKSGGVTKWKAGLFTCWIQ